MNRFKALNKLPVQPAFLKGRFFLKLVAPVILIPLIIFLVSWTQSARFDLRPGDKIAIIGNGLADRMQHDGWLETYLQSTYPTGKLVFRNLGYTGDQVHYRPRAHSGFGDSDTHLTNVGASVIFAFFGYNESFEDKPAEFKKQLVAFIDHTRKQKYDKKAAPRLVLFSPIAHENLESKNLPDGKENNRRLLAYSTAMSQVAREKGVAYVDLFNATQKMYDTTKEPLTINGIHLNNEGNRRVALYITETLFGKKVSMAKVGLDSLRSAVVDKNWHWFNRYRSTSGNDVWGTRTIQDGNHVTLQNELKMFEAMTANRDKRIWVRAQGKDAKVDDSNVPPPYPVGTHITRDVQYLSAEDAIKRMTIPKDMKVTVFAAEDKFPEIANPVAMQVDTKGQMWVASWADYPKWEPMKPMRDRIVTLTDENGDGVADKATTFAYVTNPTGFEFWNGGVIVVSAPDILFLKDTNGDGVADVRYRMLGGLGSDDTHHTANNLIYGPDGNIYYQRGIFILENIETPWRKSAESGESGLYRFNPRTFDFSLVVDNSPNPHGISFDKWGNQFISDGTSGRSYQVYFKRTVTSTTDKGDFEKRPLFKQTIRPFTSNQILSSGNFPEEYQNNYLVYNVIGFQGIKRYKLNYLDEGVIEGEEVGNLIFTGSDPKFAPSSEATPRVIGKDYTGDPNFRPSDGVVGFDGALYFADWHQAVITHSPYNLRDISRDHTHGRIYRMVATNRPLQKPVSIYGQPVENLLELFRHPIDGIRHAVRVELSGRNTDEVIQKAQQFAAKLDPKKKEDALPMLEILWLHQQHNVVNRELLVKVLASPEYQVRLAAQKVNFFWSGKDTFKPAKSDSTVSGMNHRIGYEKFWKAPVNTAAVNPHQNHNMPAAAPKPAAPVVSKGPEFQNDKTAILTIEATDELRFKFKGQLLSEFSVKASQPVEMTVENLGLMPHNLLISKPGTADVVAQKALELGEKGAEKHFNPGTEMVLYATKLLNGGGKETIKFNAPSAAGEYPFVCTFPGHSFTMRGIMKVVN
ncbi:MAG: PVC-type heme-binding CxxCH protein [Daejeonella sp.]